MIPFQQVEKPGSWKSSFPFHLINRVDADQAVGILVRERKQQYAINDAEHDRTRGQSHSEREYRDCGETRTPPEGAEPEAKVLHEAIKPRKFPGISRDFFDQFDIAEFSASRAFSLGFGRTTFFLIADRHLKV